MKIHTDNLSAMHIVHALNAEKTAGRIAHSVTFKTFSKQGSRTHKNAFEVQLSSSQKLPGDGRRAGNSGSYGADTEYAATYDEWGWLIAAIYKEDPYAVWGTVKNPIYKNAGDFNRKTGRTYAIDAMLTILKDRNDPYPYVSGSRNGIVGRMGAGRMDHQTAWNTYKPRTLEEYKKFAHV